MPARPGSGVTAVQLRFWVEAEKTVPGAGAVTAGVPEGLMRSTWKATEEYGPQLVAPPTAQALTAKMYDPLGRLSRAWVDPWPSSEPRKATAPVPSWRMIRP